MFEPRYTDEQREAVVQAALDRNCGSAARIVALAASGELLHRGVKLPAFTMPAPTASGLIRNEKRRRGGELESALVLQPPADGLELVRRRLGSALDHELKAIERQMKAKGGRGDIDADRLHKAMKLAREWAAYTHDTKPKPSKTATVEMDDAKRAGATRSRVGLAAEILAAHKATAAVGAGAQTAAEPPSSQQARGTTQGLEAAQPTGERVNARVRDGAGSLKRGEEDGSAAPERRGLAA